jgi:hypothetical protein
MPAMAPCLRGSQEMKAKEPTAFGEVRRMNNRSRDGHTYAVGQNIHPASFALDSVESRAAARVLAESREPSTFHCGTCFLSGLPVMAAASQISLRVREWKKDLVGGFIGVRRTKTPAGRPQCRSFSSQGSWERPHHDGQVR